MYIPGNNFLDNETIGRTAKTEARAPNNKTDIPTSRRSVVDSILLRKERTKKKKMR